MMTDYHEIAALLSEAWDIIAADLYDELGPERQEVIRQWLCDCRAEEVAKCE